MENRADGALSVVLQFLRVNEPGDPFGFRFEPQDYILQSTGGETQTAHFEWTAEVMADLDAVRLPGRDPEVVQRVGDLLGRFIENAGWSRHDQAIADAVAAHRPIIVTICSSAAELYALPWELLTLKSLRQFLCEVDGLLLRYEWPKYSTCKEEPSPRAEGGRILFAWSAAEGEVPAAPQLQAITAACSAGFHPFSSTSDEIAHASIDRIVNKLEEAQKTNTPISVLHLLCHGGRAGSGFGLCLDGKDGKIVVDAATLRKQLAPFAKMVRLIVLSACDSGNAGTPGGHLGSIAQELHCSGFAAVIASRFPLSVDGACLLTEELYTSLLRETSSLETAFLNARKRLFKSEEARAQLDWASVQLYARHEDGDDTRPIIFRPYRGLLAFQLEQRRFFVGRDREAQAILQALRALTEHKQARFVVIAGASGTGKSSVVFAGAVPTIQTENPQLGFLRMRPGKDPLAALKDALATYQPGTPSLLVVDQFEEIFTQTEKPEARNAFVKKLWQYAAAPDGGLSVLITLRVDFIGRCGELTVDDFGLRMDRVAYQEEHRVFVAQLEREELRAAIVEPAARVGLKLESRLAERIIDDVGKEPGALPLLEDALDLLWQHREGALLTQAAYDELGGVIGALERRADAIVGKLAKEELEIVQRLLVNLVAVADDTALDTRLRVALGDLQHAFAASPAAGFERVLKEMVAARLLVQDGDDKTAQVEVAHEALIRKWPRLRAWLDEDRAALLMQRRVRQAAAEWARQKRDESLLYRGAQLDQTKAWRVTWESRLGVLEQEFLRASDALRARRRRYFIGAAIAVAAALCVLALLGISVREQRARASQQERLSKSMLLVAKSVEARQPADLALLLAVEARHMWDSPYARSALLSALQRGGQRPLRYLHGAAQEIKRLTFTSDDRSLLAVDREGTSYNWDLTSGQLEGAPRKGPGASSTDQQRPRQMKVSPDGSILAMVVEMHDSKSASHYALRFGRPGGQTLPTAPIALRTPPSDMQWSFDGRQLASVSADENVLLWDPQSGASRALNIESKQPLQIQKLAFSTDGDLLAGAAEDGSIRVWMPRTGTLLATLAARSSEGIDALAFGGTTNNRLLAVSDKSGVVLWQQIDGRFAAAPLILATQTDTCTLLSFSTDGKSLAASTEKNSILLFNGAERRLVETLPAIDVSRINALAFSRDGRRLASADGHNTITVWELAASSAQIVQSGEPREHVKTLVISRNQNRIAWTTPDAPDQVHVRWVGAARDEEQQLPPHPHLTHFDLSADGLTIVTASASDGHLRVWNLPRWTRVDEFNLDPPSSADGNTQAALQTKLSAEGRLLGLRSGNTIRFRDLSSKQMLPPLDGRFGSTWALSPDDHHVLLDGANGTLSLWDLRTGQQQGAPFSPQPGHERRQAAGFAPDGTQLIEVEKTGALRVLDVGTRRPRSLFFGSGAVVEEVQQSADGLLIAVSRSKIEGNTQLHFLQLWDAATGYQLGPDLAGHLGHIISQRFDESGRSLWTADQWGTVIRWDVDSDSWSARACRTANRNLTMEEWRGFFGDATAYRCICKELPPPTGIKQCAESSK